VPAWLVFLLSGAAVVLAGMRLARDGDAIAERTGLGAAWVGAILVAAATSLPELTTDVYAVRQGNASLAIADLFGSSMANMLILAIADLVTIRRRILMRLAVNQAIVGTLAITLTAVGAVGILTGDRLVVGPIGWAPIAIGLGYLSGMRLLHLNREEPPFETAEEAARARALAPSLRRSAVGFALAALVILVAARFLAASAADVADAYGLSRGFVGLALLAVTTSLPELTVTLASVRAGSYDLAVGNLLGSNCFNMTLLAPLDLVDGAGSLLARAEPSVTVGAIFALILTGQTLIEVLNRSERRIWFIEPNAALRIATYALGLYLVYQVGGG
jgi:cation:H+ antiporter